MIAMMIWFIRYNNDWIDIISNTDYYIDMKWNDALGSSQSQSLSSSTALDDVLGQWWSKIDDPIIQPSL